VKLYCGELQAAVDTWTKRFAAGDGLYWNDEIGLFEVENSEPAAYEKNPELETILANTHSITSLNQLLSLPGVQPGTVTEMIDKGILFQEGQQIINLAARVLL
jgi:hypothetical protein